MLRWDCQSAIPPFQTRLNRLVDKGVVKKSDSRPAMYEAAVTQEAIAQNDLELLLKRVSNGEVVPLVAHLVQDRKLSASEIDAIRNLIDNAEVEMLGQGGFRTNCKASS